MPSPIVRRMESTSKRIKSLLPFANGGFLTNKFVLYLVLFAALFDVFHFYQRKDLKSVMIFFLVGILVSFFSKNMVVILILAIVVTHLIRYGKNLTEGFEETDETKEPEEFAAADETEATEDPDAFVGEEEEEKEKEEKDKEREGEVKGHVHGYLDAVAAGKLDEEFAVPELRQVVGLAEHLWPVKFVCVCVCVFSP